MQTLFHLRSGAAIDDNHTLLAEAGPDYCACAYYHKAAKSLDEIRYFSFAETEAEESVANVLADAKGLTGKALVCSAFTQALLVPTKFFTGDYAVLDAIYDGTAQTHWNDAIPEWQMTNVYSMPAAIHQSFQAAFANLQFFHAYTPAVKIYNGYVADNQIAVDFTRSRFRVLFKKDSTIQLAQTYAYKTPLDVVYFLLKICYEFGLMQGDVHLILSGLIEKESALFADLQQYFSNVHFAHPPEMALPEGEHPQHFFTSLYNLAQCAS